MWVSNLRQHIARDHTRPLVKSVRRVSTHPPEAIAHRKLCYPPKTATNNPEEDINESGEGN